MIGKIFFVAKTRAELLALFGTLETHSTSSTSPATLPFLRLLGGRVHSQTHICMRNFSFLSSSNVGRALQFLRARLGWPTAYTPSLFPRSLSPASRHSRLPPSLYKYIKARVARGESSVYTDSQHGQRCQAEGEQNSDDSMLV